MSLSKQFLLGIMVFGLFSAGCRGRKGDSGQAGSPGTGTVTKLYEGTLAATSGTVFVRPFQSHYTISVYYDLPSNPGVYLQLFGPIPSDPNAPYYFLIPSVAIDEVAVNLVNLQIGSRYRIVVIQGVLNPVISSSWMFQSQLLE